jgi:hypothetical protein
MELHGLVSNFYIHVSVSDLYIPKIGPQTQFCKIGGPTMGIYLNCSQIHECRNWERGSAVSFLGIFGSHFLYSELSVLCTVYSTDHSSCLLRKLLPHPASSRTGPGLSRTTSNVINKQSTVVKAKNFEIIF